MFYDERIHAGRGKAFRKTMVLGTILFALYAVLHLTYQLTAMPKFNPLSVMTESICALVGAALILYGEVAFRGSLSDEMGESQKNCYFAKAFYTFLYTVVGVYCVVAPLYLLSDHTGDYPPNIVLFLVEIPCWLFLLLQFKTEEMPINSEILAESKKIYWMRVLKNVLKFGGVCAGFTCLSFCVTLFSLMLRGDFGLLTLSVLFGILFAGIITWISLSLEYLLFSLAERSSDRAKQKGVLSPITLVFAWAGLGVTILINLVRIAILLSGYAWNSGVAVAAFIYMTNYISWIGLYFTGLFTAYFLSELRPLADRRLTKILSRTLCLLITEYSFSILFLVLRDIVLQMAGGNPEADIVISTAIAEMSTVCSLIFLIASSYLTICCFTALAKHRIAGKWYWMIPAFLCLSEAMDLILQGILMRNYNHIVFYALSVLGTLFLGVLYSLMFVKIKGNPFAVEN